MAAPYIIAIDQGTTSSRAIAFNASAEIIASHQEEFPQIYPEPGWVEHDLEDIWRTTAGAVRAVAAEIEKRDGVIAAIGITNQRETTAIWDRKTLKPIANAIVWQDRRTAPVCEKLRAEGHAAMVADKAGLVLDPYFSATKIAWLLDHVDGAREKATRGELCFGTIDAFLLARLTGGVHATDATNASRTSLYNLRTGDWDEDLLKIFDAPAACLPEVMDNIADFGMTTTESVGFEAPIYSMIGDQQAAAVGQTCFDVGEIKSTYGTGCFALVQTGDEFVPSRNNLLTTVARRIDGRTSFALEGSIFVAGAGVQWIRDNLKLVSDSAETEGMAQSVDGTGGVYFVPAFAGLGAPHWAPDARGAIVGLSRGSGAAEIARAALESVAYQTADLFEAMAGDGARPGRVKVDGGMVANSWMLQFLADVCRIEVERPVILETTAMGAALLAGSKAGVYGGLDDLAALRQVDRSFYPQMGDAERNELLAGWRTALNRVLM